MGSFHTITGSSEAVASIIQSEKPKHLLFDHLQKVFQSQSSCFGIIFCWYHNLNSEVFSIFIL